MSCLALKILISYLTNRELEVKYHNAVSSRKRLPGGGPQGCALGGIVFIVKFNGALLRPRIPSNLLTSQHRPDSITAKYFDDATEAVEIDLRSCLTPDPFEKEKTLTFHEHCQLVIPKEKNKLQLSLDKLEEFVRLNKMTLNNEKSKIMVFNPTRLYRFPPELTMYRKSGTT